MECYLYSNFNDIKHYFKCCYIGLERNFRFHFKRNEHDKIHNFKCMECNQRCGFKRGKCYPKHSIFRLEQHFFHNFIGDEYDSFDRDKYMEQCKIFNWFYHQRHLHND